MNPWNLSPIRQTLSDRLIKLPA